ncbi:hypothetical protein HDU82_000985 [Entophlyctis luteolus]|nr:hypothetical protein HDU82_000985 [Entophlyctis luteolus]
MCVVTPEGHLGCVTSVAFTNDDKTIVSGCLDGTVNFWNFKGGCLAKYVQHGANVGAIAMSDFHVVSVGFGGAKVWSLSELRCVLDIDEGTKEVISVSFSRTGTVPACGKKKIHNRQLPSQSHQILFLATVNVTGEIKLWTMSSGLHLKTFAYAVDAVLSVTVTQNSSRIVAVDAKGRANVLDLTSESWKSYQFHSFPSYSVAVYSRNCISREFLTFRNSQSWKKLMHIPGYADGRCTSSENVILLTQASRVYVLKNHLWEADLQYSWLRGKYVVERIRPGSFKFLQVLVLASSFIIYIHFLGELSLAILDSFFNSNGTIQDTIDTIDNINDGVFAIAGIASLTFDVMMLTAFIKFVRNSTRIDAGHAIDTHFLLVAKYGSCACIAASSSLALFFVGAVLTTTAASADPGMEGSPADRQNSDLLRFVTEACWVGAYTCLAAVYTALALMKVRITRLETTRVPLIIGQPVDDRASVRPSKFIDKK